MVEPSHMTRWFHMVLQSWVLSILKNGGAPNYKMPEVKYSLIINTNVMHFPFLHPDESESDKVNDGETFSAAEHSYVSDGCEFIDDGIRSKDQPLVAKPSFPESAHPFL